MINLIVDILIRNKGEILDKRLEELLKKEFPYVNSFMLDELYMKLESIGLIYVYRVSKNKNMIVFNKDSKIVRPEAIDQLK